MRRRRKKRGRGKRRRKNSMHPKHLMPPKLGPLLPIGKLLEGYLFKYYNSGQKTVPLGQVLGRGILLGAEKRCLTGSSVLLSTSEVYTAYSFLN
jgi:hypothetical protein